jgi:hypothetical protein
MHGGPFAPWEAAIKLRGAGRPWELWTAIPELSNFPGVSQSVTIRHGAGRPYPTAPAGRRDPHILGRGSAAAVGLGASGHAPIGR